MNDFVENEHNGCSFFKAHSHSSLEFDRSSDVFCSSLCAKDRLTSHLLERSIFHKTAVHDYQDLIESNRDLSKKATLPNSVHMSYENYPTFAETEAHLKALVEKHSKIASLASLGKSHEKRDILLLKVGNSPLGENRTRAVWVDAGIHAREWIAPITGLYQIDRILDEFSKDSSEQNEDIVGVNWYFVPLLNPDGYEYTQTKERLWRKSRSPPPDGSTCYGVDLNRNWDVVGFGVGASKDPCDNTYAGKAPNSEPEVKAVTTKLMELKDTVRASVSLHSYGSMWLTSWGYKAELPVDDDKMMRLGNAAAEAIEAVNGRKYKVGAAGKIFYPAGGASDDFAKAKAHIPYAVTVELPGEPETNFEFPPSGIKGVGAEMWAAMKIVAKAAREEDLGPDPALPKEQARDARNKMALPSLQMGLQFVVPTPR